MPIRPENAGRYPDDWPDVSRSVKERAGWRCECEGECGRGHKGRCDRRHGAPLVGTYPVELTGARAVVLTTAHLDHTPENCDPANLRAMCQGCHLHYDREHHRRSALEQRRRELEAAGQAVLF